MSVVVRKYIPLAIVAVLGFFMIFSYPLDNAVTTAASSSLGKWVIILSSFALGLGAINMFLIHGKRVTTRETGRWQYSLSLLGSLVIVALLGFTTGVDSDTYAFLYDILIGAGRLTFVSLRGFFVFSAFYRAFRARTWEGGVMLAGTILVMMYQVPIAELFFPQLNVFTKWLLDVPFVAGNRAIAVIGGIAMVIMAFRIITGIDKSWMGGSD